MNSGTTPKQIMTPTYAAPDSDSVVRMQDYGQYLLTQGCVRKVPFILKGVPIDNIKMLTFVVFVNSLRMLHRNTMYTGEVEFGRIILIEMLAAKLSDRDKMALEAQLNEFDEPWDFFLEDPVVVDIEACIRSDVVKPSGFTFTPVVTLAVL